MSSTTNTSLPILNPYTPLAFVLPHDAAQAAVSRDLLAITLGILLWDVVMSMPDEILMCKKRIFSFPDAIYLLSRLTTTGSVMAAFVFTTTPLDNCQVVIQISCWLAAFSVCLNSALFLMRIFGVFYESLPTKIIFAALWLSTFTSFIAPFSASGKHLGPTKQCVANSLTVGDALGYLVVGIFDTLVFLAITAKILADNTRGGWKAEIELLFDNRNMGKIYRTVLQTGQLYYLVTVGINIFAIVVIFSPSIPPVFKMLVTAPNISLQNSMACRVFRMLRLSSNTEHSGQFSSTISGARNAPSTIRFNVPTHHRSSESNETTDIAPFTEESKSVGEGREMSEASSTEMEGNQSQVHYISQRSPRVDSMNIV